MQQIHNLSVIPRANLDATVVTICDWRGYVVWISQKNEKAKPGDLAWQHLAAESQERAKTAFSRVVTLREEGTLELQNDRGEHFRAWFWPLASPEVAVCVLSTSIPQELDLLTLREREILGLLGQGRKVRDIASELDVSASTVHTHLRRVKEKLSLTTMESLTGFAARYCYPESASTLTATN